MSARCHWGWASLLRRLGVTGTIVVCSCALALAGSPQLHELLHHNGQRPAHSCEITLPKACKYAKALESPGRPLVHTTRTIALPTRRPLVSPLGIPRLFLEACLCEHGPPVLC